MIRGSALLAVVTLIGTAPFQCKSEDPAKAREDTPGEALWQLCGKFATDKNDAAARATLDYLIDRYPSSRMATRAKDERGAEHPCVGVAAEASAQSTTKSSKGAASSNAASSSAPPSSNAATSSSAVTPSGAK